MKTLNYSIFINAPREKVWETMLGKETYEEWTKPFNPTSHFKGDWSEGSKMIFLGSDPKTGEEGGMVSRIKESRPFEYLSIEHLGEVKSDGTEELWEEGKIGLENYTLLEKDMPDGKVGGGTEVQIEMTNVADDWTEMMDDGWPKALEVLKRLAEE